MYPWKLPTQAPQKLKELHLVTGVFLFVCLKATSSSALGLLLSLHSGITPAGAWWKCGA